MLTELLGSPNLYVMQIEMDVYALAKKVQLTTQYDEEIELPILQWLFLAQNPDWSGNSDKLLGDAEEYFRTEGSTFFKYFF